MYLGFIIPSPHPPKKPIILQNLIMCCMIQRKVGFLCSSTVPAQCRMGLWVSALRVAVQAHHPHFTSSFCRPPCFLLFLFCSSTQGGADVSRVLWVSLRSPDAPWRLPFLSYHNKQILLLDLK